MTWKLRKRCDVRIDISKESCGEKYSNELRGFYIFFTIGCVIAFSMGSIYFALHLYNSNFVWKRIHKIILNVIIFGGLQLGHAIGVLMEIKSSATMEFLTVFCWFFAIELTMDYSKEWYHIISFGESFVSTERSFHNLNQRRASSGIIGESPSRKQHLAQNNNLNGSEKKLIENELKMYSNESYENGSTVTESQQSEASPASLQAAATGNTSNLNHDDVTIKNSNDVTANASGNEMSLVEKQTEEQSEQDFALDVTTFHKIVFQYLPEKWSKLIFIIFQRSVCAVAAALAIYGGYERDKGNFDAHSLYSSISLAVMTAVVPGMTSAIILYGGEVIRMIKQANIKPIEKKLLLMKKMNLARMILGVNFIAYGIIACIYAALFNTINRNEKPGMVFVVFYLGSLPLTMIAVLYTLGTGSHIRQRRLAQNANANGAAASHSGASKKASGNNPSQTHSGQQSNLPVTESVN